MDKQCKLGKRLLAVVLAVVLVYGSAGTLGAVPAAAAQSGDDGTTNWGFIVPVTHQTTVPAGYTGIYTAQDLDNIRNDVDRWGYISDSYILMNNIDLGDYANWEPIGSIKYERDNSINFGGVFDGNGYEITSLKISQNLYENLSGTNPYVQYVIGLFGFANYNSTIKNLAVSYNITVSASTGGSTYIGLYVGGLTGSGSTIVNCTSSGTLSATSTATRVTFNLGGIAASADSIIDCVNKASITYRTGSESSTIGGISAYSGTIDGCFNIGNISVQSSSVTEHAGGITGSANTITNCKNSGTIKAYGYAGGITGTASNTQNCSNEGIISALCAGGIAGDGSLSTQTVTIMDCNNAGAVSGSFAGGIIGDTRKATCLVSACANTGGIQASIYGGGIVGTSSYTASNIISACYNAGKITTNGSGTYNVAGGILGYNNSAGSISGCFNIGHVTATNSYSYGMAMSGGIVGMGGAICANVYNKGFVESNATAEAYAGGIVGFYAKSIENSYNAGKISATSTQIDAYGNPLSKAGGILGINPSGTTGVIINKAYWLNTTTAVGIGETGDVSFNTVSLTDTQMRQQASFVGFDFDGVWDIDPDKNEGYPFLQSMVVPEGGGDDPDDPNATIDPNLDWWGFPNLTSQNITQELFQRVFGKKKGDKYYNDCIKDGSYNDGSGGHCFGMAATTAAINQNNPAVSTFAQGQHEHLATVKLTDKSVGLGLSASDYINVAHVMQYEKNLKKEREKNKDRYDALYKAVSDFAQGKGAPVVVTMWGNNRVGKFSAHAVYALRIDDDREDSCKIVVNDSNGINFNKEMFITLSKSNGKINGWSFPYSYNITWGSDKTNGAISFRNPASAVYSAAEKYSEKYGEGTMQLQAPIVDTSDYLLMSSNTDNFSLSADGKTSTGHNANLDILIPFGESENGAESNGGDILYWVDSTKTVSIYDLVENSSIELTSDDYSIAVDVPKGSTAKIDVIQNQTDLTVPKNSMVKITHDGTNIITASCLSGGQVRSSQIGQQLVLQGCIGTVTLEAETNGITDTKTVTGVKDGDTVQVTIQNNKIVAEVKKTTTTPDGGTDPTQNPNEPAAKKYIKLWGKQTSYESNFLNWLLCIFLFGWIWMAF